MTTNVESLPVRSSRGMFWTGWALSGLPVLFIVVMGSFAAMHPEQVQKDFAKYGYPDGFMNKMLFIEAACLVLYIIPQTAVLGAILFTGYLGGAVATHARVGEANWIAPVIVGVVMWLGLWFRDARIRSLTPLRRI